MPRITRTSESESERRPVRKTRQTSAVLDSPVRRSTRNKRADSSPESVRETTKSSKKNLRNKRADSSPESERETAKSSKKNLRNKRADSSPESERETAKSSKRNLRNKRADSSPESDRETTKIPKRNLRNKRADSSPESERETTNTSKRNIRNKQVDSSPESDRETTKTSKRNLRNKRADSSPESERETTNTSKRNIQNKRVGSSPESERETTKTSKRNLRNKRADSSPESERETTNTSKRNLRNKRVDSSPESVKETTKNSKRTLRNKAVRSPVESVKEPTRISRQNTRKKATDSLQVPDQTQTSARVLRRRSPSAESDVPLATRSLRNRNIRAGSETPSSPARVTRSTRANSATESKATSKKTVGPKDRKRLASPSQELKSLHEENNSDTAEEESIAKRIKASDASSNDDSKYFEETNTSKFSKKKSKSSHETSTEDLDHFDETNSSKAEVIDMSSSINIKDSEIVVDEASGLKSVVKKKQKRDEIRNKLINRLKENKLDISGVHNLDQAEDKCTASLSHETSTEDLDNFEETNSSKAEVIDMSSSINIKDSEIVVDEASGLKSVVKKKQKRDEIRNKLINRLKESKLNFSGVDNLDQDQDKRRESLKENTPKKGSRKKAKDEDSSEEEDVDQNNDLFDSESHDEHESPEKKETSFEKNTYLSKTHGLKRVSIRIETPKDRQSFKRESLSKTETPKKTERVQTPDKKETPRKSEIIDKKETPKRIETPSKKETPKRTERVETPNKKETPRKSEIIDKKETPKRIETPSKKETPKRTERVETPNKKETPRKSEIIDKKETPKRIETPSKKETSIRTETPGNQENSKRVDTPIKKETPKLLKSSIDKTPSERFSQEFLNNLDAIDESKDEETFLEPMDVDDFEDSTDQVETIQVPEKMSRDFKPRKSMIEAASEKHLIKNSRFSLGNKTPEYITIDVEEEKKTRREKKNRKSLQTDLNSDKVESGSSDNSEEIVFQVPAVSENRFSIDKDKRLSNEKRLSIDKRMSAENRLSIDKSKSTDSSKSKSSLSKSPSFNLQVTPEKEEDLNSKEKMAKSSEKISRKRKRESSDSNDSFELTMLGYSEQSSQEKDVDKLDSTGPEENNDEELTSETKKSPTKRKFKSMDSSALFKDEKGKVEDNVRKQWSFSGDLKEDRVFEFAGKSSEDLVKQKGKPTIRNIETVQENNEIVSKLINNSLEKRYLDKTPTTENKKEKKGWEMLISSETELSEVEEVETVKAVRKNRSSIKNRSRTSAKKREDNEGSDDLVSKIPTFMFSQTSESEDGEEGTGEEASKSIDSDIAREYNLDGKRDLQYSDDDVPGDMCRASESEHSDSEDDGSDLGDFIADDDEEIEKDDSEDEGEEGEETEDYEEDKEENSREKEAKIRGVKKGKEKKNKKEDSDDDEEEVEVEEEEEEEEEENEGGKKIEKEGSDVEEEEDAEEIDEEDGDEEEVEVEEENEKEDNIKEKSLSKQDSDKGKKIILEDSDIDEDEEVEKKETKVPANEDDESTEGFVSDDSVFEEPEPSFKESKAKVDKQELKNKEASPWKNSKDRKSRSNSLKIANESQNKRHSKGKDVQLDEQSRKMDQLELEDKERDFQMSNSPVLSKNSVGELLSDEERDLSTKKRKLEADLSDSDSSEEMPERKVKKESADVGEEEKELKNHKKSKRKLKSTASKTPVASSTRLDLSDLENEPESLSFAEARQKEEKARDLEIVKKGGKKKKKRTSVETAGASGSEKLKRLPDEVLQNLEDAPRPNKKRKMSSQYDFEKPSRNMQDIRGGNLCRTRSLPSASSFGSTTDFDIVNIKKEKKPKTQSSLALKWFKQRMLARNIRQPISALLSQQQKRKASDKERFSK